MAWVLFLKTFVLKFAIIFKKRQSDLIKNNFFHFAELTFILKLQLNKKDLTAAWRSSPERFLGEARTIRYKYAIIVRKTDNYIYQCPVCSHESNRACHLCPGRGTTKNTKNKRWVASPVSRKRARRLKDVSSLLLSYWMIVANIAPSKNKANS